MNRPSAHRDWRRRLLLVPLSALIIVALGACSDDSDEGLPRLDETSVATTAPSVTEAPASSGTLAAPNDDCGLRTPELPGTAIYCDALEGIADGSVEVQADPEFCVLAATAPPEMVTTQFFGRTDVVREMQLYFTAMAPLAPPELTDQLQQLADISAQYLALLEQRDAGEITAEEAEAEFQTIRDAVDAETPDLLPSVMIETVTVCTPRS